MHRVFLPFALATGLLFNGALTASGTTNPDNKEKENKVKTTVTARTQTAPVIDGVLEPDIWHQVSPATNFVRYDPFNGKPSSQKTEVYMLYDDEAVYIGAMLYDTAPDSILTQLGTRDSGENNADMFGVYIDTYHDKQNAFSFLVSASGVQTDIKLSQNDEDWNWNAVWASKVSRNEKGWVVEMRLPYAALRFPNAAVQTWGLNFMRVIRRSREKSYWNHVDNSVQGFVNQEGRAIGIEGIKAPVRLQFTPYVSGYVNHYSGNADGNSEMSHSVNGGMDVKYGINDAFTLDVTLIPDFGQTQSDNQVLNLSPFEVKYSENRQFFTEGTELFNKGSLFYSRRIGGTPLLRGTAKGQLEAHEELTENPAVSSLVNAAKVSGRTRKGLGIGLFNAVTRNMFATAVDSLTGESREILTDPVTNYNVFVLDQTLPRNSFLTFTNTNVTRGKGIYDANVSGLQVRFADKSNTFALRAGGNLSQLYGKDTDGDGASDGTSLGHQYNISLAKVSGNLLYSLNHNVESDTYDINDLGFLRNNNEMSSSAQVNYNFYQPIWKFLNWNNRLTVSHAMLYAPRSFSSWGLSGSSGGKLRNFTWVGVNWSVRPEDANDYFEARAFPRVFVKPPAYEISGNISTDYRKRLALDASLGIWQSERYKQSSNWWSLSPRFRVNDKLLLVNGNSLNLEHHDIGYVGHDKYLLPEQGIVDNIIFGDREVKTFTSTLSGSYIFNENTGLTLNMRHYWSRAAYNRFFVLTEEGMLQPVSAERQQEMDRFKDINYNAFNIDLVYSWRFAPGSELRVVWKNAIQDNHNQIVKDYFDNVSRTFQAPQNNNFSVKLLYFIDYIAVKNVLSA
ncbi:carbohydrate binding protein with CBM9 domain [Pontibacter ummariensis]|uniref:Carbohydrate family 9 binding domain-like n=1 Tax=Pontibacter ummariensis TaxID=1610492 RepID=A0A239E0W7_9BACT|nr:DUF5916 domain-containing protein [Pontibacter ummariensis]PRY13681.1 carbohydrate binding protein with CBM9 domain [Pontibacter ummariensis]SNS37633.1 Carbohydrate family 9 binding domain-like [Pontibacter ummariensis]